MECCWDKEKEREERKREKERERERERECSNHKTQRVAGHERKELLVCMTYMYVYMYSTCGC